MKDRRKRMTAAMVASLALLVTAGFANAASMSGYTAFKDGVRATLNLSNATVEASYSLTVDGAPAQHIGESQLMMLDVENGALFIKNDYYETYTAIGAESGQFRDTVSDLQPEVIRVVEILADALSGSAKDYFFTDEENGLRVVTAKLSKEQVPEIAGAVINLALSSYRSYGYEEYVEDPFEDDPWTILEAKLMGSFIKQAEITGVDIRAVMDDEGNITDGRLKGTALFTGNDGVTHEAELKVEFTATDIGTTVVTVPGEGGDA